MAWQFISKEQQKKAPIQWGQFIPKWTVNVPITEVKSPINSMLQRSAPLAVWAGGLAWSYVAGKALKWVGKAVYGVTLPPVKAEAEAIQAYKAWISNVKPRTTVQTMLDQPLIQVQPTFWETITQVSKSPWSIFWEMGTRAWIWVQSEVWAKKLRQTKVEPALMRSKATVNIQWAINELWDDIVKLAKNDPDKLAEYLKALDELKVSYADPKYANMQLKEVQTLKSWLQWRTPAKFFKWEEITNAYRELRWKLSSKLVNKLHTELSKEAWEDTAKLYRDYNNLKSVAKIWPKSLSQAGRMWGAGSFTSWVGEELATPITTTVWKLTYKAWKMLQYLPQKVVEEIKKMPSRLKWMPLKEIAKLAIKEMPAWILAEQFGRVVSDTDMPNQVIKDDLEQALKALKEWKKIPTTSFLSKRETKWLDIETSIILLEKALSKYK